MMAHRIVYRTCSCLLILQLIGCYIPHQGPVPILAQAVDPCTSGEHVGNILRFGEVDGYGWLMPPQVVQDELSGVTVCFWMKTTDTLNSGTPFSYGNQDIPGSLVLSDYRNFRLTVGGQSSGPTSVSANDGSPHHICATWRVFDGEWRIFKDGVQVARGDGLSTNQRIQPHGLLFIGNKFTSAGFNPRNSFRGDLYNFNIWAGTKREVEIRQYYDGRSDNCGDVLSWGSFLSWPMLGSVRVVDESDFTTQSEITRQVPTAQPVTTGLRTITAHVTTKQETTSDRVTTAKIPTTEHETTRLVQTTRPVTTRLRTTTADVTTEQEPTIEDWTTEEKLTTELVTTNQVPVTTEKISTAHVTIKQEITTDSVTTAKMPTTKHEISRQVYTTRPVTTKHVPTTRHVTTPSEPTTEDFTTEQVFTSEDMTSEVKLTTEDVTTGQLSTTEHATTGRAPTTHPATTKNVPTTEWSRVLLYTAGLWVLIQL